jgi:coenzyme F420-0:L-glutamate ligase/coenzyme F420-1:gamma-L-glutamate ligase
MANAGIDASNVNVDGGDHTILLLPHDPDQICRDIRDQLVKQFDVEIGVLINDSFGRPWRHGTTGVAIGAAGLPSLWDRRGDKDLYGRELKVSQQAIADELAGAASLLQGQGAEGRPIVIIRGFKLGNSVAAPVRPAADLIRDENEDLFR